MCQIERSRDRISHDIISQSKYRLSGQSPIQNTVRKLISIVSQGRLHPKIFSCTCPPHNAVIKAKTMAVGPDQTGADSVIIKIAEFDEWPLNVRVRVKNSRRTAFRKCAV
jgi:hypothetical protein